MSINWNSIFLAVATGVEQIIKIVWFIISFLPIGYFRFIVDCWNSHPFWTILLSPFIIAGAIIILYLEGGLLYLLGIGFVKLCELLAQGVGKSIFLITKIISWLLCAFKTMVHWIYMCTVGWMVLIYKRLIYGTQQTEHRSNRQKKHHGTKRKECYANSEDIRSTYYLKNGQKNGPETFYYHSGKVNKKQYWQEGQLHGECCIYYPTGDIYIKQVYQQGKLQGAPQVHYKPIKMSQTEEMIIDTPRLKRQEDVFESAFRQYKKATYRKREKKTIWNKIKKGGKIITGIQAYQDRKRAKDIETSCQPLHQQASRITQYRQRLMKDGLEKLGKQRMGLLEECVGKFLGCLRDMDQNNKEKMYELLDKADIGKDMRNQMDSLALLAKQTKDIDMSAGELTGKTILVGTVGTLTAAATPGAVMSAVGAYATASTGTAISSLHGVAATNATLAWLGGGSIASGHGGVAAGTIVLGGLQAAATGAVALVFAGLLASSHYSNKLTKVEKKAAEIATEVKQMESCWPVIDGVIRRTNELISATNQIAARATESLSRLLPLVPDFDCNNLYHTQTFQRTALFMKTLIELINTPLLDEKGDVSVNGRKIIESSKKMLKNTELVSYE